MSPFIAEIAFPSDIDNLKPPANQTGKEKVLITLLQRRSCAEIITIAASLCVMSLIIAALLVRLWSNDLFLNKSQQANSLPDSSPSAVGPDLALRLDRVKALYEELWTIRTTSGFIQNGFVDQKAKIWLSRFNAMKDDMEISRVLLERQVAIDDLYILAKEWRKNYGAHSESSNRIVALWDSAFGLTHETGLIPKQKMHTEIKKPAELSPVGLWRMSKGSNITQILITDADDGRFPILLTFDTGEKLVVTAKETKLKRYRMFEWDNPTGDYIILWPSGDIELRDNSGVVSTSRK